MARLVSSFSKLFLSILSNLSLLFVSNSSNLFANSLFASFDSSLIILLSAARGLLETKVKKVIIVTNAPAAPPITFSISNASYIVTFSPRFF
jgi:hypothetical protein